MKTLIAACRKALSILIFIFQLFEMHVPTELLQDNRTQRFISDKRFKLQQQNIIAQ